MLGLYGIGTVLPKKRPPIIVYHSVDESGSCISIKQSLFKRQMELIKESGYRTITVRELVDFLLNGEKTPDKAVVLTFDDGFESNYSIAFPILKELGFTATIFLTTDYINKTCAWDKEDNIPDLPLLSWEMIEEMSKAGIDFQSHTATHPHLQLLSYDKIRDELSRSRKIIEDKLNKKCDILCYPYAEFDNKVIRILQEEKFTAAFAGQPEHNGMYSIKRIGSGHLTTILSYRAALRGRFEIYYDLKKIFRPLSS